MENKYMALVLRNDRPGYLIAKQDICEECYVDIKNRSGARLDIRVPAGVRVFQSPKGKRVFLYAPLGLEAGDVIEIRPQYFSAKVAVNGFGNFRILRQKHITEEGGLPKIVRGIKSRQPEVSQRGAA